MDIDQCGNGWCVDLYSHIISNIVFITKELLLLKSFFPGKRMLERYSLLTVPLSGKAEEVHFG